MYCNGLNIKSHLLGRKLHLDKAIKLLICEVSSHHGLKSAPKSSVEGDSQRT